MKKLSVLLVAMAVAVSASAGVSLKANRVVKNNKIMPKTEMTKQTVKMNEIKGQNTKFQAINVQPEGEVKYYNRSGDAIYPSGGSLYSGAQSGRMEIVYADGGKVYLKNILYNTENSFGDYWVEGQLNEEGTEITVPMGQSIYYSDYYGADVVLCWGESWVEEAEDGTYLRITPDERITEVVYTIDGETIYGPEGIAPDPNAEVSYPMFWATGLAGVWTDDGSFGGGMEWNTVLTETEAPVIPTVITQIPENCQVYTYYRNSACVYNSWLGIGEMKTDGKINVAFDMTNGDVYIQNPLWWHDGLNSWVKGTYDWMTGIITVPTGQYLSYYEAYEYGVQLVWGYSYVYMDTDEEGEEGYYLDAQIDDRTTEIQFMIDDDCLYLLGTEGDINAEFPENYEVMGMMGIYSDDLSWTNIEFANRDEYGYAEPWGKIVNLVPAVPADPTADDWYDCGDESGFSKFYFTLPTEDVNGNMLDPEYLSYSIFIDNGDGPEIFHFTGDDYTFDLDPEDDITEVPYSLYNSAVDFDDYYIYMYRTNEEGYEPLFTKNIGIQVYYTVNGVSNANAGGIIWLYPEDTNVSEQFAGKTIANVRYFNVAGQEMAQPEGMTIMVTTYTDGTTKAVKVVK